MDLNDAERYAVAALFTLALHSTHVESGVDKNGNSLSESDIAWGCPSEELFDEQLLSQVPLKLPPDVLDIFWGWDCMAPAGLAPRLYAWLKIPRKAWPGLLRMPDLAGCAGSVEAVEAFVTLVRRYSAFLDPELAFTTGQASRLQQHFSMPAAVAVAEQEEQEKQEQQPQIEKESQHAADPGHAATASNHSQQGLERVPVAKAVQQEATATTSPASLPAAEAAAAAAAAASITAAAIAAEASATDAAASSSTASVTHQAGATTAAAAAAASSPGTASASEGGALQPAASVSFDELRDAVDMLPKEADEGSVVPAATFTPAQQYKHTTSHKAVLALYEVIGGCLASNTEHDMEPLFEMAAQEAETAAIAAAAAKGNKKALQHFKQQQQQASSSSSKPQPQQQLGDTAAACADPSDRPPAAWFPDDGSSTSTAAAADSKALAPAAAPAPSSKQQEPQSQEQKQLQQQQQLQGVAAIQWYDARARVAVKRVAHWLRVPWPQVRAFEQMWSAQALSLDAATAKPKYETNSRAVQYLKVGAAAVGGGALLAVTGGLAAPAIAAGLGAAVTLAHGGAAVAAAVTGFAGSTAGTAAVTGLFGAWGASVGGGSARTLYGEVTEFGFWDFSQSIYVDGKGPEQHTEEHTTGAADKGGDADAAAPADSTAAAAAAASPAAAAGNEAAAPAEQQQQSSSAATASPGKVQPSAVQQQGFLHRLFSAAPKPDTATGSSSSSPQSSIGKAAATSAAAGTAAAAAASSAGLSGSKSAATPAAGSPCASPVPSNPLSPLPSPLPSPMQRQQQQQQQASPSSKESQQAGQHPSPRGPLHMFGWGKSAGDDEDEGPAPRVRSKAIKLRDSAFTTDSDEDAEDFYEEYLGSQASGPHTPRTQARSTTPSTQRQQLQQQQSPGRQQEHNQQQQQQPQQAQELTAVEVKDDPLSSTAPCSTPQQDATSSSSQSAPPEQQHKQAGREQERKQELQQQGQAAAPPNSDKHPVGQQQEPQQVQPVEQDLALATAAAAAAAAGTAAAAAASEKAGSSAAAPSSSGVLSGLFSRKQAPPPPVYVPLLPTPVNPKHKDETRMALTIAVNGCCIEKMEDYVEPWKHLPSSDCDRFALVWESACLKELGRAVVSFLAQQALTQVAQKSIQTFLYTGLVGALALPMTLSTAMRVAFGSKWLVALRRAQAAGKMLAMQLAQGCHGGRPVTLIGCSMGARLVFHCLLELARLGLRGCVENVILLGAPLSCRPDRWCAARSVVAGRLINGYSVNDWTLGLLYRVHSSSSIWLQAAGMYKVEVPGIENVNLSRLISGHQDYLEVMDDILEVINLHDV